MVNDVSKPHVFCSSYTHVFVELPSEDEEAKRGEVGRLNVCLYGTRDAAREWQSTLSRQLEGIGFKRGKDHPAIVHHPSRDVKTRVHGDYYVSSAMSEDLDWLESELGKVYEIKTQRTKPMGNDEVEAKVLNRVVRRNERGYRGPGH